MSKIRVTKMFEFEMAHALHNYDGLCRNIHGHTYKLSVTVIGEPEPNPDSTKLGMVMDFGNLKRIVKQNIVDKFDHSVLLSHKEDTKYFEEENKLLKRIHIVNFQPTAENMVIHFADIIKPLLPENIKLHSIKLHETTNSFAEWYASDQ
ncbi:MAG: 6-carboxytetrahydropterin synthase QueD [Marinilabiliales bacterium]|nr:MAG: 6-carboxytetrahydropterin synthase QueD [Marinilabiliales bacterium]